MKKKLENELMGLAHRILQLGGQNNTEELKSVARELYEKLAILDFAEKHFAGPQPTIGRKNVEQALEQAAETAHDELSSEDDAPASADIGNKTGDLAPERQPQTDKTAPGPRQGTEAKPSSSRQDDLRNIAVHYDDLPQFEPLGKSSSKASTPRSQEEKSKTKENKGRQPSPEKFTKTHNRPSEDKKDTPDPDLFNQTPKTKNDPGFHKKSLNERLTHGLKFGLNDRLAFINQLFEGSSTDFNRVVSQLNTFEDYTAAKQFIEQQVKPDYNWEDKTVYEERFFMIIEKRLNG